MPSPASLSRKTKSFPAHLHVGTTTHLPVSEGPAALLHAPRSLLVKPVSPSLSRSETGNPGHTSSQFQPEAQLLDLIIKENPSTPQPGGAKDTCSLQMLLPHKNSA